MDLGQPVGACDDQHDDRALHVGGQRHVELPCDICDDEPLGLDVFRCGNSCGLHSLKLVFHVFEVDGAALAVVDRIPDFKSFSVHDLRRTASTQLHEAGFNSDWIEKCLAHEQRGVRAVYNKAEYAEQRRTMLQVWAEMLVGWIVNNPETNSAAKVRPTKRSLKLIV